MLYDGTATKSIDLSLTDTVIGSNKLWPTDTKTITTDDLSKLCLLYTSAKVFVIDDSTHSTMLLAEEY